MEERRKTERKDLVFFTRIFNQENGQLVGHLADLSSDGLMLISDIPIDIGQTYQLSIDLPRNIFEKDNLSVQANSIWCKPDIDPEYWNIGFQLQNATPEDIKTIERIIQEYDIRR